MRGGVRQSRCFLSRGGVRQSGCFLSRGGVRQSGCFLSRGGVRCRGWLPAARRAARVRRTLRGAPFAGLDPAELHAEGCGHVPDCVKCLIVRDDVQYVACPGSSQPDTSVDGDAEIGRAS